MSLGDITFQIVGSANEAKKAVSELKGEVTGLDTSMKNLSVDKLANTLNSIASAVRNTSGVALSVSNLALGLQTLQTASAGINASGLTDFFKQLNQDISDMVSAGLPQSLTEVGSALDTLNSAVSRYIDNTERVAEAFVSADNSAKSAETSVNDTGNAMDEAGQKAERAASRIASVDRVFNAIKLTTLAGMLRKISQPMAKLINEAAEYQENLNLFTVSMGAYADSAMAYGERVSEVLGIDISDWIRNQGVFNALLTGFNNTADRAALMSKNLTQLGYDISSFYNIDVTSAMTKLQAAMSGELEPIRRLGVDLSKARLEAEALAQGIDKSYSSMTQAEKAELRYVALMKQLTNAQGDLARTINAPANQLRILTAQLSMAGRAIGNILIPALNMILPVAIAVVKAIRMIADAIASLLGFEIAQVDYSGLSTSMESLSVGADDAGAISSGLGSAADSAKKMKDYMMGFDELNVISPDSGSSSGGGGGGGASAGYSGSGFDFDLPQYDMLASYIGGKVDEIQAKLQPFVDWFIEHLDMVRAIVIGIGTAFLAWKLAATFVKDINGLGSFLSSKIGKVAMGITLVITGIQFTYDAAYNYGRGTDDTTSFVEAVLGALATVAGSALIGFQFGGVPGALIGATIGVGIEIVTFIVGYREGQKQAMFDEWLESDAGKRFQEFRQDLDDYLSESLNLEAKLSNNVSDPTAEAWAKLSTVEKLVNSIFDMDAKENKTATEIALIQSQIETLNGMDVGITLGFDTLTEHVTETREAVNQLISALEEQIRLQAAQQYLTTAYQSEIEAKANIMEHSQNVTGTVNSVQDLINQRQALQAENAELTRALSGNTFTGSEKTLAEMREQAYSNQQEIDRLTAVIEKQGYSGVDFSGDLKTAFDIAKADYANLQEAQRQIADGQQILGEVVTQTGKEVSSGSKTIGKFVDATGNSFATDLPNKVQSGTDKVTTVTGRMTNDTSGKLRKATTDASKFGLNLPTNFGNGIKSNTPVAVSNADRMVRDTHTQFKAQNTHFTADATVGGRTVGLNFSTGISSQAKAVQNAVNSLFGSANSAMGATGNFKAVQGVGATFSKAVAEGFNSSKGIMTNALGNILTGMQSQAIRGVNSISSNINAGIKAWAKSINSVTTTSGKINYSLQNPTVKRAELYASGGYPDEGEVFIAREAGAEMVGSIGGRTAVANNDQIVEAVSQGVYSAVVSAMGRNNGQNDVNLNVYLDGKQIEASVRKAARSRGANIGTGGIVY